jgi:hypothetical protein
MGDLQDGSRPRGVVERAVVDGVAVDRRPDAEVIEVRAVDDVLPGELRIAAAEDPDDVVRLEVAELDGELAVERDGDVEALECARVRSAREGSRVATRAGPSEDGVERLPVDGPRRGTPGAEVPGSPFFSQVICSMRDCLGHASPRRPLLVLGPEHGDHPHGAPRRQPGGLLAPVAVDRVRDGRKVVVLVRERGAGEEDGDLALQVEAGEIVVPVLRAVTPKPTNTAAPRR